MIFAAIPIAIGIIAAFTKHYGSAIVTGVAMVLLAGGVHAAALERYEYVYGTSAGAGVAPTAILLLIAGIVFIAWGAIAIRAEQSTVRTPVPATSATPSPAPSRPEPRGKSVSELRATGYRWGGDVDTGDFKPATPTKQRSPAPVKHATRTTAAGRALAEGYRWKAGTGTEPAAAPAPRPKPPAQTVATSSDLEEKRRQRDALLALVDQLNRELGDASSASR